MGLRIRRANFVAGLSGLGASASVGACRSCGPARPALSQFAGGVQRISVSGLRGVGEPVMMLEGLSAQSTTSFDPTASQPTLQTTQDATFSTILMADVESEPDPNILPSPDEDTLVDDGGFDPQTGAPPPGSTDGGDEPPPPGGTDADCPAGFILDTSGFCVLPQAAPVDFVPAPQAPQAPTQNAANPPAAAAPAATQSLTVPLVIGGSLVALALVLRGGG